MVLVTTEIDVGPVAMELPGGLALLLFGMEQVTPALKVAAGSRTRSILMRLTANRFRSAATRARVTAVIQSSS
jgi:phosphate:Na+ symporter